MTRPPAKHSWPESTACAAAEKGYNNFAKNDATDQFARQWSGWRPFGKSRFEKGAAIMRNAWLAASLWAAVVLVGGMALYRMLETGAPAVAGPPGWAKS